MSLYPVRPVRRPVHQAAALAVGSLLLTAGTLAQAASAGCERFKATLAERLPDPSTYTLDAVPAATPLPKGAKVVGNCDGNTVKIIFRRGKQAPIEGTSDVAVASPTPAPAPVVAVVPPPAPVQAPPPPPPPPPPPKPAPPPEPAPAPRVVAVEAPAPQPIEVAASEPAPTADAVDDTTSWTEGVAAHWPWLTLGLVPLLLWGVARVQHRRHYDAAGLPRGPRL